MTRDARNQPTTLLRALWVLCTGWLLFGMLLIARAFGPTGVLYLWSLPALPLFVVTCLVARPPRSGSVIGILLGLWIVVLLFPPADAEVLFTSGQFVPAASFGRVILVLTVPAAVTATMFYWLRKEAQQSEPGTVDQR